jgi:hypothetical protein
MSADKWTPDHLRSPAERAIHLEQRRAQLLPIVDDLRRLAREMEAEVKEIDAIEGDIPGQARIRAWRVTRPLFAAADDVEKAISDLISFNARYQRSYEDLPDKRADKRQRKELAKAKQPKEIPASSPSGEEGASGKTTGFGDVFDGLRKGA